MDFVDLRRCFAPIHKDQQIGLDAGRIWGSRIAGWLDWPGLLKRRRVVLLAEASSGKSEEFREQQRRLAAEGKPTFFVSIEQLADHGLDAALDLASAGALKAWNAGTEAAYFFLDSVDEARLNRKNFDAALRRFARELGDSLGRAHLFISCRVSDWRGQQDRDAVMQLLPVLAAPPERAPGSVEPDRALLAAIFESKSEESKPTKTTDDIDQLLIVQLVPLDTEQRRALTLAARINDTEAFMIAIDRHGLEALAERPGDLLDLVEYWRTHGRFASLEAMTEHAVSHKLAERDKYRPDNDTLTADRARHGAERMAAALTLAKTFTVRAPAQDLDPSLAAGALDADHVLPDWKENERNALMRRPAFAPATYGRIRFHHRTTQEYLTASWFDHAMMAGAPKSEVWPIFFAERYGVETVIPSMRAAAAWFALKYPDFRDEIIRREPLLLIQNGDPGSLPLPTKRALLVAYAERHALGEIAEDHMDHRAIWMFARPELADAIRQSWRINSRQDFRRDLLRMVHEAKVATCNDLAREALTLEDSDDYTRIAALAALEACNDFDALADAAATLVDQPENYAPYVASRFSRLLYPKHLSTQQLLHIIEHGRRSGGDSVDGFPSDLEHLFRACPDAMAKEQLFARLAEFALRPPFVQDYQRISRRYKRLAECLGSVARLELEAMPTEHSPSAGIVRLLMAVERANRRESQDDGVPLSELVRGNARINQALFWADVADVRAARGEHLTRTWQVYFGGYTLWNLMDQDLDWLKQDLANRDYIDDRRIALSAIVRILLTTNRVHQELASLRQAIAGQTDLEQDLANHLAPPPDSREESDFEREMAERRSAAAQQTERDKESWRQLRRELTADPGRIRDRARLVSGDALPDLIDLTRWLKGHTGIADTKSAALHWRQLSIGFDLAVAEAYHDAMLVLWRITAPERPQRSEGRGITTKWANELAFASIGIEAGRPNWSANITREEAAIAAGHACLCEEGYPVWLDVLLDRHPDTVLPVVRSDLEKEWQAAGENPGDLLQHLAHGQNSIHPVLHKVLFEIISVSAAPEVRKAEKALHILQRIEMDVAMRILIKRTVMERLSTHHDDQRMLVDLAALFLVDADAARDSLIALLEATPEPQRRTRTEFALARLFGRDHSLVPALLATLPIPVLNTLARFTYAHVSPNDDTHHEGTYTPDTRDEAESARNALLNAMLDRPGEDAFVAVHALANAGIAGIPATRFRELARGKAERDCEVAPWLSAEIVTFEKRHTAPIRTADDLFRVVIAMLADIQRDRRTRTHPHAHSFARPRARSRYRTGYMSN